MKDEVYTVVRGRKIAARTEKKPQPGHPYTKKIKVVCKRCNETWMGDIEEAAKPVLIAMLSALPMTLTRSGIIAVADWFVLKLLVVENETPTDVVVRQEARTAFMNTRKIPDKFKVWLFHHNSETW
jgi:hypothetical protein